jgi:hypothetical protein
MARKEKNYHFIYKTINTINNKFYIGMHSTDKLNDGYVGSGTRLWYSINKYGKENHKLLILEFHPTRILLKERERELINDNQLKDPMCMNCKRGGEGGLDGLCDESIAKIRKGASEFMTNLWKDEKFITRHIQRSSERMKDRHKRGKIKYNTFTDKKHTEETKRLMSIKASRHTGNKNSQFGTCWITKDNINKKIKNSNLLTFTNEGWHKGRIM